MLNLGISIFSEGTNPILDIIAVHGLGGDSCRTWTHKNGTLWLRDFLPADFPIARIMAFGYDSRIRGNTLNGFRESAQLLLSHLQLSRQGVTAAQRPIIFICHSLGGIIVKEALVKASNRDLYSGLRNSTIGVIFMGTPHRGSPVAPLGSIVANVAKSLLFDISTKHLEELAPGSLDLEVLTTDFSDVILHPKIEIVSFFETSRLKLGFSRILVVQKSSAILDPEASDHQAIPLHGDHRQLCQFSSREDSQYRLVKGSIIQILEKRCQNFPQDSLCPVDGIGDVPSSKSSQQFLAWLNFQTPIEDVPFEGTCTWIHQKSLFRKWYDDRDSEVLWIKGAPGIGKTVLASYITTFLRANSMDVVIHAQCVKNKPNALKFILRSIVGQLLREIPYTHTIVCTLSKLEVEYPCSIDVPFEEMLVVLSSIFNATSMIILVLDGLDEAEDDPELDLLLNFLARTSEKTGKKVKTLLLSRDVSFLQHLLPTQPSFNIEPDDTIPGILQFVQARINALRHLDPCSELIREVVAERSKGLFLWVEYFMNGFEDLRNINEIHAYLENARDGLSPIYENILSKLETNRPSLTELRKKILTIAAASLKPLTLPELEEALVVRKGIRRIDRRDKVLGGWDTIHTASGPLLQLVDGRIELFHLSASEFILASTETIKFASLPLNSEEAHGYMAAICLTYLSFLELEGSFTGNATQDRERQIKYPLLEYAALHWADHFIKSGSSSPPLLEILQFFITRLSGITWAVSYFTYFKLRDGESVYSTFGLLQSKISQLKIVVRKGLGNDSTNNQRASILKNLDVFLIRSFEKAVSLETEDNGAQHPLTMERQLDLSKVYQASRDLDRAYITVSKVYQVALGSLGPFDPLVLRCKHQQLQVAMELEQLKAKPSFHEIRNSFEALSKQLETALDAHHKDALRCQHDIGYVLSLEGKTEEALKILNIVLSEMRQHLGRHATLTQRTANNVANALYDLDRLDEVEAVLSSIPEVRRASRPTPTVEIETCHPYTFDSLEILALTLCEQGNFDRSIIMHERAMRGRAALFGPNDTLLFIFARNLGSVFEWQRQYETAAEHYKTWLYAARKYGIEVQSKSLQQALDDHLERWAAAIERGDLVHEDEGLLERYRNWYKSHSLAILVFSLLFFLSLCYLLYHIIYILTIPWPYVINQ